MRVVKEPVGAGLGGAGRCGVDDHGESRGGGVRMDSGGRCGRSAGSTGAHWVHGRGVAVVSHNGVLYIMVHHLMVRYI